LQVLSIDNLSFWYQKDRLLYQDFSISLQKGEIKSVVGPSGSGKSTLFELITKEIKPKRGNIDSLRFAQIFQDPYSSFHHTYSILNQIEDVVEDMSELDILIQKLNLSHELLQKKPYELSGGQLQRCSILRAILMKPDLLLADEPTSALDNVTALEVMRLLVSFLDRFGILLITHDKNLAKWASDDIIVLKDI
jgi:peptide/nickel transport system ATP-binding protein